MPIDIVCGIEMDEDIAVKLDYEGGVYYFCCDGCKRIFLRKPNKYLEQ